MRQNACALVVQLLDAGVLVFFSSDEAGLFDLEMLLLKHEPLTE